MQHVLGELVKCLGIAGLSNGLAHPQQVAERLGLKDVANVLRLKSVVGAETTQGPFNIPGLMASTVLADLPFYDYAGALNEAAQNLGLHNIVLASDNKDLIAEEVTEWEAIPVPAGLNVGRITISPSKVAILAPFSSELIRSGQAATAIENIVKRAVSQGMSAAVIGRQLPGSAGGIAAGSDALQDIRKLLTALATTGVTRPVLCTDPTTAVLMATLRQAGVIPFPAMTAAGGEVCGSRMAVSDRLASGTILGCDPAAIAFTMGEVEVAVSTKGSIVLDTAPSYGDGTQGQSLVSGWQTDVVWCRVMCAFSYSELRPESVSEALESVEWSDS